MPISIPLIFHLNQHLTEEAHLASRTCYKGLLRVLRSHPSLPVNIQISGTLIHALQWLDPEPLQLIWEGLRAGQFELLGSTYAQNVAYASDDWDNQRQIDMHLEVIHDTFGVTPVTFWNPEGSWRQSLLPLIAGAGYRFTLLEDFTLAQARLAEPVVVTSQVGAHILTLVYDDQQLKHLFNFAVWFSRPGQLQSYLMSRADHPNASQHCLAYAGNAEAMGYLGWQEGIVPNQVWHRLDQVLSLLEALPEIQLIHLTNAPPSAGNLSPIPDGSATWMDVALAEPEHPNHEADYEDWFDFNENSPKLDHYRDFFGEIRAGLQRLDETLDEKNEEKSAPVKPARALYKAALHNYLSHQYEFACVGVGGEGYRGWEGAQASWALMRAAEWALDPHPFAKVEDVNGDGQEEIVICDGERAIVTTPAGGRLLYWFDLTTGKQYVGNQRAVPEAPYESDAALPELEPLPYEYWLPEDYRPQAIIPGAKLTAESAPTRMGKYLPDWIWEGEREPFELLTREVREPGTHIPLPAQRRGFVDYIVVDGEEEAEPGAWIEGEIGDSGAVYTQTPVDGLTLSKRYALEDDAVVVTYKWENEGDAPRSVSWRVLNELCPDYASFLEMEREAVVEFVEDEERPGVANMAAREGVFVHTDRPATDVSYDDALLALEIGLTFQLDLAPGESEAVTVRLLREAIEKSKKRRR
ncbi:MAG: hypothetical protein R3248_10735 [Candidatus Promineifilaceae bacterium]|nr:hypothetical protein [Candidatus Promineifilaceae bacterium]